MKNITLATALAFASLGAAQAQDMSNTQYGVPATMAAPQKAAPQEAASLGKVRPVLGMGLTFGGDKIATLEYEGGSSVDVRAGSMLTFYGGADFRITRAFSMQATIGYHVDNASAKNGDIRFERMPIELLAYGHIGNSWRLGGGVRYVSNPKIKSSGVADIGDYSFDNAVGGVIEGEYMISQSFGVKVRYVSEKYKLDGISEKLDGSHVGFMANYYF